MGIGIETDTHKALVSASAKAPCSTLRITALQTVIKLHPMTAFGSARWTHCLRYFIEKNERKESI